MPARSSAYAFLAIVLVLLAVTPAVVNAGGNGTPADRGVDAPPVEDLGSAGTREVTPRAQAPASEDGLAATPAPTTVTTSPKRPATTSTTAVTATPSAVPTGAGGAAAGGDGGWRADGGKPLSPVPPPAPATTGGSPTPARTGTGGAGKGVSAGVTVTTAPAGGARAVGTPAPSPEATGAVPGPANRSGAQGAVQTTATAGVGTPGAASGAPPAVGAAGGQVASGPTGTSVPGADAPSAGVSTENGPGADARGGPAVTGAPRATAGGAADGQATVTPAAGTGPGVQARLAEPPGLRNARGGVPAGRDGAVPTVGPSPDGMFTVRFGAASEAGRAGGAGGAGGGGAPGGPGRQNAGRERGPFDPPAAAPARTGLEPADRPKDEGGRGRRGLPTSPVPGGRDGDAPDPLLLLRFLLFLGYRRVRPGNLLDHPLRQSLYAAIRSDPGLDLIGCAAVTGANRETLRYHLSLLVCGGRVVEETRNGSVRYFPHDAALSPVRRAVIHLGRNPGLAPALRHIRERPGIPRRELAALLGVAGPTVTRQVRRLVDEGLVENRGSGLSQGYWLTPGCADALASMAMAETERDRVATAADSATA